MAHRLLRQPVAQPVGASACCTEGMENPETGELETLMNAPTMFQAAQRIGRAIRTGPRDWKARRSKPPT